MTPPVPFDAAIIGGGPAGSAVGRLLASWGHAVTIVDRGCDRSRGLAESLPPSTFKLLTQLGLFDAVERAGFMPTRGNTVRWATREPRIETFADGAFGYQVFRPEFDRLLLDCAAAAGAHIQRSQQVADVSWTADGAVLQLAPAARNRSVAPIEAKFVIDCSGRAGIIGRRYRVQQPGFRTFALVGAWTAEIWDLPDPGHTAVETFANGWAWSVPIDAMTRHVGVMVGDALPSPGARRAIDAVYRERLARAPHTSGLVATATLDRAWACDAALYHATQYAGDSFLLVGDAGSFIDPLSSFGVKKALASAWLGAVAVHTALIDRERRRVALDFFDRRERQMYAAHLERSRSFAQSAWQQHPDPFWKGRADAVLADVPAAIDGETTLARDPAVVRAFERIRTAPRLHLAAAAAPCIEHHPVVRGQEIVLEPAFADGVRFFANVDLLELAKIAPGCRDVPDLFEAYCRRCPPVPLPSVIGGLSLLVARGILHDRT